MIWIQPEIKGSVQARYLHSATVYNDKLFVYGGFAKSTDCKIHSSQRTLEREEEQRYI